MRDITKSNIIHFKPTKDIKQIGYQNNKLYIVSNKVLDFGELNRLIYELEFDTNPQPMFVNSLDHLDTKTALWSGSKNSNIKVHELLKLVKDDNVSIEVFPIKDIDELDLAIVSNNGTANHINHLKLLAGYVLGYHSRYVSEGIIMNDHEGSKDTKNDIVNINIVMDVHDINKTTIDSIEDTALKTLYNKIKSIDLEVELDTIYGNVFNLCCQEK